MPAEVVKGAVRDELGDPRAEGRKETADTAELPGPPEPSGKLPPTEKAAETWLRI